MPLSSRLSRLLGRQAVHSRNSSWPYINSITKVRGGEPGDTNAILLGVPEALSNGSYRLSRPKESTVEQRVTPELARIKVTQSLAPRDWQLSCI